MSAQTPMFYSTSYVIKCTAPEMRALASDACLAIHNFTAPPSTLSPDIPQLRFKSAMEETTPTPRSTIDREKVCAVDIFSYPSLTSSRRLPRFSSVPSSKLACFIGCSSLKMGPYL